MRKLLLACLIVCSVTGYLLAGSPGLAYLDQLNVFTANQRINAGLGVNVAPGAPGTLSTSAGLFERSRSTAMGEWIPVPYSAGNFTASGSMSWTVTSGEQITYAYMLIGKTMTLEYAINLSTVGGTPDTELRIAIPGGFVAQTTAVLSAIRAFDNGSDTVGFNGSVAGQTYIRSWRSGFSNWAASTTNTTVQGVAIFQVQ